MNLIEIRGYLKSVTERPSTLPPEQVLQALATLKEQALQHGDQTEARLIWCLQESLIVQNHYIEAFRLLKTGRFYDAWCVLEQAELSLKFLEPHDVASWPAFKLDFIRNYVAKWQSLFPYKIFLSAEEVHHEVDCFICGQSISPRKPCGHVVGEIYNGRLCFRIVNKVDLLGVALVSDPVHKCAVPFISDPVTGESGDHYNYKIVRYAINALRNPFDGWSATWTTCRLPHSRYRQVGRNEPCPCSSGRKYKLCCLQEKGVLHRHLQFSFEIPPPAGTPSLTFD